MESKGPAVVCVERLCKVYRTHQAAQISFVGGESSPGDFVQILLRRLSGSIKSIKTVALTQVSFEVRKSEIVGVFGPNGSGKTTLLKILGGLLWPTSGSVRILGHDVRAGRKEVLACTNFVGGLLTGGAWMNPNLSARRNLLSIGRLFRLQESEVDRVLALVGLSDVADHRVGTFSSGMAARLLIGVSLVRSTEVLLLDEPTVGISPETVRDFRAYLRSSAKEHGVTVLYATHLLEEVEELCDRVLILRKGEIVADGTPRGLAHSLKLSERVIVSVEYSGDNHVLQNATQLEGVKAVAIKPGSSENATGRVWALHLEVDHAQRVLPNVINWLVRTLGLPIISVQVKVPTLHDIYFRTIGID